MRREVKMVLEERVEAGAVHGLHAAQGHVPRVLVGQVELDDLVGSQLLQVLRLVGFLANRFVGMRTPIIAYFKRTCDRDRN